MLAIHQLSNDYYLLRSPEPDFNRNIYLRIFRTPERTISILMDPGARPDLEALSTALQKLIGNIKNLSAIFLSHQDPDLSGNVAALLQYSPAFVITSEDTWRLLRTAGLEDKRFIATESFRDGVMHLRTGHSVQFIPAYFCHFRGATMMHDPESGILFSGDLMGGLLSRKGEGFYATQESFPGVAAFHRLYMPTQRAVAEAIRRIKALNPPPLLIAPQHGDLIPSDLQESFFEQLTALPMGIDAIVEADVPGEVLRRIFNRALGALKNADEELFLRFTTALRESGNFTPYLSFSGSEVEQVKVDYFTATEQFMAAVNALLPVEIVDQIKTALFAQISELGLKLPPSLLTNLHDASINEFLQ